MLVPFAVVERSVTELVGETDIEALSAERVVETILEALHPNLSLACSFQKEESVLLDMLLERRADRARVRARHARALPRDLRRLAAGRAALRDRGRGVRGPVPRPSGGDPRRGAVGAEPRSLLLDPQGRAARHRARRPRRLDHRRAPRPVADARGRAEARLGRAPRALEGESARGLDGRRRVDVHRRARPARQRAPRAGLRLDRLHALHRARKRPRRVAGSGGDKTECGLHA